MKQYGEIKKLPFEALDGISKKTIEHHYGKLYQGYVKKWQEIQTKLEAVDKSSANATFSDLRELKMEQGFAADAVLLHEAYFDILGGDGEPKGEILGRIEEDFNGFERWQEEFKALGLCSRGWTILAFDFNDAKLRNYISDSHNQGGIWGSAPLLVLDVYEHAYFMDYASDRKSYIEAFFRNLNWKAIEGKFQRTKSK